MKKTLIVVSCIVLPILLIGGCSIGTLNQEARLRVAIEAKLKDNTSEFDNMKKKISNVAEVSEQAMEKLKQIFVEYAEARTTDGGGSLAKWVSESVPNVNSGTYDKLINTITASRDSWTQRQKELIDLSRSQNEMYAVFPDNMILSIFGRKPTDILVITSANTKRVFETQEDNDSSIFKKDGVE
jgi:hypothetical protein